MDETTRQTLAQVVKGLQPQADEYRLLWINWWGRCLTKSEWASWVQAGFPDTVIETTDKVHAELLERQERDRMHSMLLTMPGFAAVLIKPQHRCTFVNRAFEAAASQRA